MSLWLTEDELTVLTGYTQRSKQKVALALMRIEFKARAADGFPLVARAQFEVRQDAPKRGRLDWQAVRA